MATFHYNSQANSSGIYIIFNTYTWNVYVGSTKGFKQRWYQHVKALEKGKHSNKHLQASFKKWGSDAFEFHVLEHGIPDKQERLKREECWISKHYKSGRCYNNSPYAISREGSANSGFRSDKGVPRGPRSEEVKRKISISNKGKRLSPEHVENMKKSLKGRKVWNKGIKCPQISGNKHPFFGKHHTAEAKNKNRDAHLGQTAWNRRSVVQLTLDGVFVRRWNSAAEAQKSLNIRNISTVARKIRKQAGGFDWEYET